MTLREWREKRRLSRRDVAERLHTDTTTIFRWELARGHSDKRIPTSGYMDAIFQLTRGAVDPNSFYELDLVDAQPELPLDADTVAELPLAVDPVVGLDIAAPPARELQRAA